MFLNDYSLEKREPIWSPDSRLKVCRISHSFNNPNWSYQYHLHKNETELTYIAGGRGTYIINTDLYDLKPGDILVIEKGAIHALTSDEKDPLNCWTCAISDYQVSVQEEAGFLISPNVVPYMESGIHESYIKSLFQEMELIQQSKNNQYLSLLDALAFSLASVYYELFHSNFKRKGPKKSSFARDILVYINENYASKITLKQLSDEFHISSDHISHEFTKVYGISPINYVIERRLSEAKWMLINTNHSLVSIAKQVGYDNTTHFTNMFVKRVKKTPLEFRKYNQSI